MFKLSAANLGSLADHATAIGGLCIAYAGLEQNIDSLIGALCGLRDDQLRSFTSQMALVKKLPTVKALGLLRQPQQSWYDDLDLFAWAIDQHIAPNRNEFVHGAWRQGSPTPTRLRERIRIAKPQSRQKLMLTTLHPSQPKSQEIWACVAETEQVRLSIGLLQLEFETFQQTKRFVPELPPEYRDHWRARRIPPTATIAKG
jgi:hypothetical protein